VPHWFWERLLAVSTNGGSICSPNVAVPFPRTVPSVRGGGVPRGKSLFFWGRALRNEVQQELKMETKTMDIRFATINDIDAVTELERQCFPPEEAAEKDSFEKRLTVFPNHFWLLEDSGKLASMINGMTTDIPILRDEMFEDATMHREEGQWQMIFGVATLPEYQKMGCASKLMERVIADVKEQERKGIVLTCKESLIPFYERFGFVNEGKSMSKHGGAVWYDMRLVFEEL